MRVLIALCSQCKLGFWWNTGFKPILHYAYLGLHYKLQKDLSYFHVACDSFPHSHTAFKEAMKLHDDTMKTLRKDLKDMGVAMFF